MSVHNIGKVLGEAPPSPKKGILLPYQKSNKLNYTLPTEWISQPSQVHRTLESRNKLNRTMEMIFEVITGRKDIQNQNAKDMIQYTQWIVLPLVSISINLIPLNISNSVQFSFHLEADHSDYSDSCVNQFSIPYTSYLWCPANMTEGPNLSAHLCAVLFSSTISMQYSSVQ